MEKEKLCELLVVFMNWMTEDKGELRGIKRHSLTDLFGVVSEKLQEKDLVLLIEHMPSSIICLMTLIFIFSYKLNICTAYYTTINSASVISKVLAQSSIRKVRFGFVLQHIRFEMKQ